MFVPDRSPFLEFHLDFAPSGSSDVVVVSDDGWHFFYPRATLSAASAQLKELVAGCDQTGSVFVKLQGNKEDIALCLRALAGSKVDDLPFLRLKALLTFSRLHETAALARRALDVLVNNLDLLAQHAPYIFGAAIVLLKDTSLAGEALEKFDCCPGRMDYQISDIPRHYLNRFPKRFVEGLTKLQKWVNKDGDSWAEAICCGELCDLEPCLSDPRYIPPKRCPRKTRFSGRRNRRRW